MRIIILGFLVLVSAGAVLWFLPATHQLVAGPISTVQTNGLYVLAATLVLLSVVSWMFGISATNARKRKRELDEYLRVAQQTAPETPQSFKRQLVDAPPTDALDLVSTDKSVAEKPPQPKAKKKTRPKRRKVEPPALSHVSDELFFQPVTNVLEDKIIGYDIFRQAERTTRRDPIFIRQRLDANKVDQAAFEFAILEKTSSACDHTMWLDIANDSQISFFVQVSGALLDDKTHWRKAALLLRKRSKSNPSISLSVLSTALAGEPTKTIKERLQKLARLHESGVPMVLSGLEHDRRLVTPEELSFFYMLSCGKNELLGCYAGEEAPNRCLTYQQITDHSLGLCVCGITSEVDVVDCISAGVRFMSGDFLAPPRKLKSDVKSSSEANA